MKMETVLWRHPSPKTGEQHRSELERDAAGGHGADSARTDRALGLRGVCEAVSG